MLSNIRRIVTGHSPDGKAVFVGDGAAPRQIEFDALPGLEFVELWATDGTPKISSMQDITMEMSSLLPPSEGSRFRIVRFPSDPEMEKNIANGYDPAVFRKEYNSKIPGISETHERDDSSMHTTDTVDYGIVLSGEIDLELDDGQKVHLKAGDCVIQNGTRHAWRNRFEEPCLVAFIMIGAIR